VAAFFFACLSFAAPPHENAVAVLRPSSEAMLGLVAGDGSPRVVAKSTERMFHEAGVWLPSQQAWLVTSDRFNASCNCDAQQVRITLVIDSRDEADWELLPGLTSQIMMANGGTFDGKGGSYMVSQGIRSTQGAVFHIDADLSTATPLPAPPGIILNSPGDIVLHPGTGSLVVTDPSYGVEVQFFRKTHSSHHGNSVWLTDLEGSKWSRITEAETGVAQPNGLCFSPDFNTLYLSSVWDSTWHSGEPGHSIFDPHVHFASTHPHPHDEPEKHCFVDAMDVTEVGGTLVFSNRRRFLDLGDCSFKGKNSYPDGLKVDTEGNVYVGTGEGVTIISPQGERLGAIEIEGGVANLVFGGTDGRTLLALNEERAIAISMNVAGVLGPYT